MEEVGDPMEAIREMSECLDRISDAMQHPVSEDRRAEVEECIDIAVRRYRKKLEDMATVVIDQVEGEAMFNMITGELHRLEQLQEMYPRWAASTTSAPST